MHFPCFRVVSCIRNICKYFTSTLRIMDGIQEASHCNDGTVCSGSVACSVALLGTLEELSKGVGLSDEHIEALEKEKEPDHWVDHFIEHHG